MAYTNNYNSRANNSKNSTGTTNSAKWTDVSGEMTIWGHAAKTKTGRNYCTYTTSISRKNDAGEWDAVWVDVVFRKEVNPDIDTMFKTRIENGFWSLRVWDDKDGHHVKPCVVITEHSILD